MNEQWEEGYQAYADGLDISECPYLMDGAGEYSQKVIDWQIGHECAQSDEY